MKFQAMKQLNEKVKKVFFIFSLQTGQFYHLDNNVEKILELDASVAYETPAKLLNMIHPEDKKYVKEQFQALTNRISDVSAEFRIVIPSGEEKWIAVHAANIINENDGEWIAGLAEDTTIRKEAELIMSDIKERKDMTLQILGHDLRAPIASIQSAVNLLEKDHVKSDDALVDNLVKIIKQTSEKALKLISDVLDREFEESQKIALGTKRVEIMERIKALIEIFRLNENDAHKNFTINSSHEKIYINIDEIKFMLVLENLLSNAYKFTEEQGNISITVEEKEQSVLFKVEDDGIGIPKNIQPAIFDKFTEARRTGVKGEKAIGLGLHLIKNTVEIHNGRIWFESEEGKGTVFFVEIPQ